MGKIDEFLCFVHQSYEELVTSITDFCVADIPMDI
jgi:hypothetical protein